MSSTAKGNNDPGLLPGPLGLNVGPPLSSRQRKAAAAFTLAQLLALAELRATTRRKQGSGRSRANGALTGFSATASRASSGLTAVSRLRQSAVKRRAEDEEDAAAAAMAPQRPKATGTAHTAVAMKRIAIVPPPGSQPPATAAITAQLGCHLARRCGGGSGSGGGAGPSSLARVYGSRVRVGQLPEDYSECFVGLEPVRQPDPDELVPYGTRAGASAGAGTSAPEGGFGGLAAPPTGGPLLGSVGVGDEMSLLFAANTGVAHLGASALLIPGAPTAFPGLLGQGPAAPVAGGLMAPFAAPTDPALAGVAGLSYSGLGSETAAALGAQAGAAAAAPDLMLDADEGSSSDSEDDDGGGGSGGMQGMETDAALGAAFDEFDGGGPLTQPAPPLPQSLPGNGYMAGFGGVGGGGTFSSGGGGGMGLAAAGMGMGMANAGGGAGVGAGAGAAGADDDGAMVEEF